MKHFAITGNIGSGKSTVCSIFEVLHIPVYYSDARAKILMQSNKTVQNELIDLLGNKVYDQEGKLNRKWMGEKIFNEPALLKKVNKIVHPAVRKDYKKWRQEQSAIYTLQESALTFEIKADKHVDAVILVYAPEALLIKRSMARGNVSEEAVRSRLSKQMDQEKKRKKADYIIDNSLGVSLIDQVVHLHNQFCAEIKKKGNKYHK